MENLYPFLSIVLLKNKGNLLPLRKEGTIAVIGPLADAGNQMVGTWSVTADADKCLSLVDAMKEATGSHANILYAKGSNICYDKQLQENTSRGSMKWDPRSPKEMIDELKAAGDRAEDVGVDIAVRSIKAVRPHCDGVHLMAIKATHRLAEIITKAELG